MSQEKKKRGKECDMWKGREVRRVQEVKGEVCWGRVVGYNHMFSLCKQCHKSCVTKGLGDTNAAGTAKASRW